MKHYLTYFLLPAALIIFSCQTKNNEEQSQVMIEPAGRVEIPASAAPSESTQLGSEVNYEALAELVREDIKNLDKQYPSVPFYTLLEDNKYFVVSDARRNFYDEHFNGQLSYGLLDQHYAVVLPMEFQKIHNPNMTLRGCLEVKKGDKTGLYNFETKQLLPPQFDYIYPDKEADYLSAYGLKGGQWFKINSDLTTGRATDFNPTAYLKNLSFSLDETKGTMMYKSYNEQYPNDMGSGRGMVVIPSYLDHAALFERSYYDNFILPQQDRFAAGTKSAKISKTSEKSITDRVMSFFVSVFEEGVDARGYEMNTTKLVVYNSENKQLTSTELGTLTQSDYFCREADYRFVNDSIVETRLNTRGNFYRFETQYKYHQVSKEGKLTELVSNRYFDFTKFIEIDESYFQGCYGNPMSEEESEDQEDYNFWQTTHLTIEELDIMRNEIFAEYGYRFTTEKWQKYFSAQSWYAPRYDDVNDLLTEIDKANLKTILRVKESMIGREEEVLNKEAAIYYAAG
jgi:hypothetical protein